MSRADANARHVELTVGELARRSGVPASTVRFYERQGLIHSRRTSGNQRRYDRDTLRRVAFVRASQRLGIRLADIGEALRLLPRARTPTQEDWARVSAGWHGELSLRIELLLCGTSSPTASAAAASPPTTAPWSVRATCSARPGRAPADRRSPATGRPATGRPARGPLADRLGRRRRPARRIRPAAASPPGSAGRAPARRPGITRCRGASRGPRAGTGPTR